MKRIFALLLTITMIVPMSFVASAAEMNEQRVQLSELSEEDCIEFIVSEGLEIPSKLLDHCTQGIIITKENFTILNM